MIINARRIALAALLVSGLAGCTHTYPGPAASNYGDANRMTMAAQVVDPDPQYDTLNPPTSGEHSGQAAERYRTDKVKQPVSTSSTQGPGGGS